MKKVKSINRQTATKKILLFDLIKSINRQKFDCPLGKCPLGKARTPNQGQLSSRKGGDPLREVGMRTAAVLLVLVLCGAASPLGAESLGQTPWPSGVPPARNDGIGGGILLSLFLRGGCGGKAHTTESNTVVVRGGGGSKESL